ncbi:MAG: DUF2945 domain-containing protein [Blastocatellia bacterium]|nr:DUF2945 domain-containing protein [Blastocatellia bacterium]
MAKTLKKGDTVEWSTSQGKTTGTVEKKLTASKKIKGHTAKASPDAPQYLVKSEKTRQRAAHKPDSLRKKG